MQFVEYVMIGGDCILLLFYLSRYAFYSDDPDKANGIREQDNPEGCGLCTTPCAPQG